MAYYLNILLTLIILLPSLSQAAYLSPQTVSCTQSGVWTVSLSGGGDATAANQTTEITRLTSIRDQLAASIAVTGTFWQSTQPVSLASLPALAAGSAVIGHVIVDTAPSTAVTGPLTDTQLRLTPVPVSGTVSANSTLSAETTKVIGTVNISAAQAVTSNAGTNTSTANLDVALSTRLKPADTLTGVTTVGAVTSITNALPAGTNRIGSVRLVDSADADLTSVKSTQTSRAIGVQELRDAGRTQLSFYANNVASGTTGTETLFTLTKSSGTSATANATTFVVTSGKKFRISQITVASRGHATATAQITIFNLRVNTAGACLVGSTPLIAGIATATSATASMWDRAVINFPEGYEITGDGTLQFCLSANAVFVTNAPTWFVNIVGYEY